GTVNDVGLHLTAHTVKCGVGADGNCSGPPGSGLVYQPACIDSVRRDVTRGIVGKVRGGETEVPPARSSMNHLAAHAVGASQNGGSSDDVAFGQGFPHPGGGATAVGIAVVVDREASCAILIDHLDAKAELLAEFLHGHDIADVPCAEAEVVADHDVLGMKGLEEDLADKLYGCHGGEVQRVLHDQDGIHACFAKGVQFVLKAHDQLRRRPRAVDLGGVRIKGHGH